MTVLLDLGNTRLKWAMHDGAGMQAVHALAWHTLDVAGALDPLIEAVRRDGHGVLGASVAGSAREQRVVEALTAHGLPAPRWVRTPVEACGVRNGYAKASKLGVDRFLTMVAAYRDGLAPCVVVSAGTALTLDALTADGRHLGGLIAPGPRLMQRALHEAAAQLPPPQDAPIRDRADDTEAAIASGCWQAAVALVERFHARSAADLGDGATLLLSGGDAQAIAEQLRVPAQVRPDMVLHGLAAWDAAQTSAS
ncbi:type III pantothenate kinase [Oleiagrimonas soli]|uniref:Type III pantothenate kinase n=1 Tax=Oleiagrimonas soli TaxID=1543381 RepID=A0A099CZ45_9GAMM|nr:type III pantothenate kinase [Oleiagrimonas soli]KGI78882.1 hypothetical protein LF63_0102870 [Oleiagrimonas soli]MBB6184311.1 type III pantothenate kinase [Oleiagrimonas soli]